MLLQLIMFGRHQFHDKVALGLDDVVDLVQTILTQPNAGVEVAEAAIKCSQVKCRSGLSDYRIVNFCQHVAVFPVLILIVFSLGLFTPVAPISTTVSIRGLIN